MIWRIFLVSCLAVLASSSAINDNALPPPHLVKVIRSARSTSACCGTKIDSAGLVSCRAAYVNPTALLGAQVRLPGNSADTWRMTNSVSTGGTGREGFHYVSDHGKEAVFTYSYATGGMHGSVTGPQGRLFVLEYCGLGAGHVWKEWDTTSFGEEQGMVVSKDDTNKDDIASSLLLRARGALDNTTMATYSIKVYLTPEFAAETPDVEGFIAQAIAETNQGYANSQVPITATLHCIELATINDFPDSHTMLQNFRDMKASIEELRDTADAAALLAIDIGDSCGVAYVDVTENGHTLSITEKKCSVGYYSFGHEIGHNYGCKHNPEESTNTAYPYGHGHLIELGEASDPDGYRTILAYTAPGHKNRVNYYSNPSIVLEATGTPTGVEGLSNNAAVLLLNRFAMEALGDESGECLWRK